MDKNANINRNLFVFWFLVNAMLKTGWCGGNTNTKGRMASHGDFCNETALLLEMEKCGDWFKWEMTLIHPQNWCNLTHFIWKYNRFSNCTENKAMGAGCFWPNPAAEHYVVRVHARYFSNCTLERVVLQDPPDNTLAVLIFVPVFLTLAMVALVVWRSK